MAERQLTQEEKVLKFIREHGSITSLQAFRQLGITRLSAKIFNLRERYAIKDEYIKVRTRDGYTYVKKYFLGD